MITIIDVFIFLHLYGVYIVPPGFVIAIAYMVRVFSFPLVTRNSNEIVVMVGANKIKFYKIRDRIRPIFTLKQGAYWFFDGCPTTMQYKKITRPRKQMSFKKKNTELPPLEQAEPHIETRTIPLARNKVHVYLTEVNQPVSHLERIDTKVTDVTTHYQVTKQVVAHAVQLPPSLKWVFWRNWILEIRSDGTAVLEATTERQPLKVNFFIRMGIRMPVAPAAEEVAEGANESNTSQQTLTVQAVTQRIGDIEKNTNMSAAFTLDCIKMMRKLHSPAWLRMLTGSIDMRPILLLIMAVLAIGAIFFLFKPGDISMLPPPPPGVSLGK